MSPLLILAWVAIGFGVGTLSAMLGIGGGLFVAPLLLHYYEHLAGIDQALIAPLAAATSLLSVWVTSLLGGLGHWRHGEVAWREALWAGLTGAVAGWLITWGWPRSLATDPKSCASYWPSFSGCSWCACCCNPVSGFSAAAILLDGCLRWWG